MQRLLSVLFIQTMCLLVASCGANQPGDMDSPETFSFESPASDSAARGIALGVAPATNASVRDLDLYYNFVFTGNYFHNWDGMNEKWFWSRSLGGWVYLLPSGDLHQWKAKTRPAQSKRLLAVGLQRYHSDPMGIIEPTVPAKVCGAGAFNEAGGCWRYATAGDFSCTAACAAHGGYDDLTRTYAGAKFAGDTSNMENCRKLINKTQNNRLANASVTASPSPGSGCSSFILTITLNSSAPTTAAARNSYSPFGHRICACNR